MSPLLRVPFTSPLSSFAPSHVKVAGAVCVVFGITACGEKAEDEDGKTMGPSSESTTTSSTTPEPSDSTPPSSTGNGTAMPPSEPVAPVGKLLGKFDMTLTTTSASMTGIVYGSPKNETIAHEVLEAAGDCEVRKPQVFSCIPDCAGGEECTTESKCAAQPTLVDAGELTITGIPKKVDPMPSFLLKPLSPTNLKYNVGGLASPPFEPGAPISIASPGGTLEAFTLHAKGIAALEVDASTAVPFEAGKAAELTWTAGDPTLARVILTIDVGHHGGSTAEIYCAVEDTGSYTVPAELVTALTEQGVSGFPAANIERRATSYANVSAGYIEFNIGSRAVLDLAIPGIVSCAGPTDCQAGEVCKMPDLVCVPE